MLNKQTHKIPWTCLYGLLQRKYGYDAPSRASRAWKAARAHSRWCRAHQQETLCVSIGTSASCPRLRRNRPQSSCSGRRDACVVRTFGSVRTWVLARVFLRACMRACACACGVGVCDSALPSPRTRRRQVECGQVFPAGGGYLVATDMSDGNPLPTFSGSPLFWYAPCASSGGCCACE
jgi:hypothetical protein